MINSNNNLFFTERYGLITMYVGDENLNDFIKDNDSKNKKKDS